MLRGSFMMMGGEGQFTPNQLNTVVGWWDSADLSKITLSGAQVTAWQDKIQGVSVTGQGANAGNIVRSTLNGEGVMSFPGSNAYFGVSTTPSSYPLNMSTDDAWILAAVKLSEASSSGYAPSVAGFGGAASMGIAGPSNTTSPSPGDPQIVSGGSFNYYGATSINGSAIVLEAHYGGTVTAEMYVNASLATPGTTATKPPSGATTGAIEFGRRMGASEYLYGLVGDIIIAKDISTSDRQKLEGYLAWKFGLQASLPPGHPYKTFPP